MSDLTPEELAERFCPTVERLGFGPVSLSRWADLKRELACWFRAAERDAERRASEQLRSACEFAHDSLLKAMGEMSCTEGRPEEVEKKLAEALGRPWYGQDDDD